jgi:alkylhydroperoxidase family enzyme
MSSEPRTTVVDGRSLDLADVAPELRRAMDAFMAVAYPGKVDLVTRELVRIYSGREAGCSICRSLRLRAAIDRGFDEAMVGEMDDLEASSLEPRRKAALRLAHAFLGDPASFDAAAQAELLEHFTPEQAAELILDLVRLRPGSKYTVVAGKEPVLDGLVYQ